MRQESRIAVNGVPGELVYHSAPSIFVKQLGAKPLERSIAILRELGGGSEHPLGLRDRKGGDWDEWPADLRIREFPRSTA
jgi:hypothetical protein